MRGGYVRRYLTFCNLHDFFRRIIVNREVIGKIDGWLFNYICMIYFSHLSYSQLCPFLLAMYVHMYVYLYLMLSN